MFKKTDIQCLHLSPSQLLVNALFCSVAQAIDAVQSDMKFEGQRVVLRYNKCSDQTVAKIFYE